MSRSLPKGQALLGAGVLVLGALVFGGSFTLPSEGGYAQVGPAVVPRFVGIGLLILGAMLLREALTGGFRGVDEEAERHLPTDWRAFAWVSGGILLYGVLVEPAGFLIASTLLFVMVSRGFLSRRWLLNAALGLAVAAFIFTVFNYGLGLQLPPGILRGVLP
ncbi:MAG TPA: tripartite tricarboxylate transporter TctB family protein [Usitatibacteraceae bacterium]|nr:tripartite tricarboxylate transporter TctB family protein [Usitatibacteraceae bacterium]